LLAGCGIHVRGQEQPTFTPAHERRCRDFVNSAGMIIRKYDVNGDGVLDRREWKIGVDDFVKRASESGVPVSSLEQSHMLGDFDLVDKNRDGRVQANELALGEGPVSALLESCARSGFKN
jgi:hypothetical protein